jgi:signal transduction histidine kinase
MTAQDPDQQTEKSKGRAEDGDGFATAAEEHGAARAESGFTIEEMVAEYRALRASVLSLWTRQVGDLNTEHIEDLMRFNEAIDQSLAESVTEFNENVEEAKEMFLAILGHDLRTPMGAIYTSAKFMLDTGELQEPHLSLTSRIVNSATRMVGMVGDLLDSTRSRLGGGIPVVRENLDLSKLLHEAVDEVSSVGLAGDADDVAITIHNMGAVIPGERLDGLFNPMKTRAGGSAATPGGPTGNLGLGLYIAERIVHAHAPTRRTGSAPGTVPGWGPGPRACP